MRLKSLKFGYAARRLRAVLLAFSALCVVAAPALAQDATWLAAPGSGNFNTAANWTPATVPAGTASFGLSSTTGLSFSANTAIGGWTFNPGASAYTFTNGQTVNFNGAGIVINGGSAGIANNGILNFNNTSTAGSANIANSNGLIFNDTSTAGSAGITNSLNLNFYYNSTAGSAGITNNSTMGFHNDSTAGSATITNNSSLAFNDASAAGSAAITNNLFLRFSGTSTAGNATIANNISLDFSLSSTAGSAAITNDGVVNFNHTSSAGSAGITNNFTLNFIAASSAGSATITNNSSLSFSNTSTAGNATITNTADLQFNDTSTAGSATIINSSLGTLQFNASSTAGGAAITNNGNLSFFATSTAGSATITNNSSLYFYAGTTAGSAVIANAGVVNFNNTSTAGSATITNSNGLSFNASSTAGSAAITNNSNLDFNDTTTAGSAVIANHGNLQFNDSGAASSATIINNGLVFFYNLSTAGSAAITNNSILQFNDSSTADGATVTNNGTMQFDDTSTAGSAAVTTSNGATVQFFANSTGGAAQFITAAGGTVDFSLSTGPAGDNKLSAGSIDGGGRYLLGANELTVGSNNRSTNVSGVIDDGGAGGSLVKVGTGTLILSGSNTYTGATTVNGGTLAVNGSILMSSGVTVNTGGTLAGTGIVGNTLVTGGTFAPGNGSAGSAMTVTGTLGFDAASTYVAKVNPATASFANVSGMATLGGATVNAIFAPGSYIAKQYTILNAGSVSGSFGAVANTNLPATFTDSLSYDARHAYLSLTLSFQLPAYGGLNGNQGNVGNMLINYFNTTGGIPMAFGGLTPAGLTQASGETAVGSQQTTFGAMTQFMGAMTDPFIAGRGDTQGPATSPTAFAEASDSANASSGRKRTGAERDAYAMFTKAPLAASFEQRWNVWAAGYGGSQTTDGNAALGSNAVASRVYGTAVGADYRFSPFTLAGFSLAGGGTNFSVVGGGTGRSDLFQAGAFIKHTVGPAYISGALAYGWQDITTDRIVTIAGVDRLHAEFNANAWSGRVEGGYRFVAPWMNGIGITPYAAGQFTTFDLPAYAEQALSGANTFALAYGSKSVTDTRSELGFRADKSYAMQNAILTLRGRLAWAHDFNPDRSIAATFQALPGASFVVGGAANASDSALTTASAEVKWRNGWSTAATFEGEFSDVTRSYAGKGVVRYAW